MRAKIQQWIYWIRGSYWFVPAMMAITAITLSLGTVALDRSLGAKWMIDLWWVSPNQADGARALLATVAGSMITVAGVTFSLTILTVSYATSHFGPRLLDNFMHDRGNQFTLGTFVATFLYCLMVLRTVRSSSQTIDADVTVQAFVPHVSVLVAIGLTLASVGVLIYFIHHVPESIHISNVLDQISRRLSSKIKELYPDRLGDPADNPTPNVLPEDRPTVEIRGDKSGYLQGVDGKGLIEFTKKHDAVVQLHLVPGEFVLAGQHAATVYLDNRGNESDDGQKCTSAILASLAIGSTRTPTQDAGFLINQIVEIAVRAMSPGENDPFTASQCIDQLAKALVQLSTRSIPSPYRADSDGVVRVIASVRSWDHLVHESLGQLVPYVKADEKVRECMIHRIEQVERISANQELNRLLREVIGQLEKADAG